MHFFFKLHLIKKSPSPQSCVCVAYLPHGHLGLRKTEKQGRQAVIFHGQSSLAQRAPLLQTQLPAPIPGHQLCPASASGQGPQAPGARALHGPSCAPVSCPWPVRSGPAAALPVPRPPGQRLCAPAVRFGRGAVRTK